MTKGSSAKKLRVHFAPDDIDFLARPGQNLLSAAIAAGVHINASCGGQGTCGTCKVLIKEGEVETRKTPMLSEEEFQRGFRQACQSKIVSDLTVEIPVESQLAAAVLDREKPGGDQTVEVLATGWEFNPPLRKLYVELPPPTLEDNVSDLARLLRGLKQQGGLEDPPVDFGVIKRLPDVLRAADWKVTVSILVMAAGGLPQVVNIEAGDTRRRCYALAFDIGTTGVRGQLLDLNRGKVKASHLDYNGQVKYGADVISRINCCQKKGGLKRLQQAVVTTINGIIAEILSQAKVEPDHIDYMVVAANTTMVQILLGLEPKYLRLTPYTPIANILPPVKASELGLELAEHVYLHTLPAVASYVGADIVAGVVGSGVHQRKKLTLYIDIGTNGEIVIGNADWMVTASCSAGPAFEGGGVKHGMIATEGAIEDFSIDPSSLEPVIGTIGEAKPKGICGSGLINITAGLVEAGVLAPNGKFNTDLNTNRVRKGRDGHEYVLAWAGETQTGQDIVITEVDIDNLMRAKAAMYAGCQTLAKSVGMDCSNLDQVIVAGAFGSHIDIEQAITIGLFPDIPRDRFVFIGNGSLLGARLTAFSTDIMGEAARVAGMMTNFELSENAGFMDNYIAALFFPHTNAGEFPSVKAKLDALPKRKAKRRAAV